MTVRQNPPSKHAAVTPSDSALLDPGFDVTGIYVGGAGNIALTLNGVEVTYVGVAAGSIIPGQFTKVASTGTTATNLVAVGQ